MDIHPRRYAGARWNIYYGVYAGVEQFAVNELQRMVQRFVPYVIETRPAMAGFVAGECHALVIGTAANNPLIAGLLRQGLTAAPPGAQGYTIAALPSPWHAGCTVVVIAGADSAGVLYGVQDLNARVLAPLLTRDSASTRAALDSIAPFAISEAPTIATRGIWTWGYVIYDYRRFLDNMARLKLNMLVLWNDCPPLNCREVIDYAHKRGIRVVLGFHWGWGLSLDLSSAADRARIRDHVVATYRRDYRHLGMDGIYFQTLTEHTTTAVGSLSTAALACRLVNETAQALFELDPDLYIQFGLHATSIQDRYRDLRDVDKRIDIVWEDAGVIPYSYDPTPDPARSIWDSVSTPAGTIAYSKELAALRGRGELALVAKGWTKLNWSEEFEHHGQFVLGERHPEWMQQRLQTLAPQWQYVNRLWQRNGALACEFYREMSRAVDSMTVLALVEDGLFEEAVQPSVTLFAQTLWNPERNSADLLAMAGSPYYGAGW